MRFLIGLLVVFAGLMAYGAHRQQQAQLGRIRGAKALHDSLVRDDSLHRQAGSKAAARREAAALAASAGQRTTLPR